MEKEANVVHIVLICDENYVMPTAVAIKSLFCSKGEETSYFVHVLGCEISQVSRDIFDSLNGERFTVETLDYAESPILKNCKIQGLHVSTAALYKFYIADIFEQYDRIIYLDGDVLVQKDLSDLYQMDISSKYAAVVKDQKPSTYNPPQVQKLGVEHSAYFNSGVMLLNLKQMREDEMSRKLIDYRLHGTNFFMDQDALNVVFRENVIYISLLYNVMSSVMGFFTKKEILDYYGLPSNLSKGDIYAQASVVHLCTKYKPWTYSNVPFADEWFRLYRLVYPEGLLERKRLDEYERKTLFSKIEHKITPQDYGIRADVIVSMTSYPARIQFVAKVIESLRRQSVQPDKIILWLAKEQFEGGEAALPAELLTEIEIGENVCLRWCDDLKPHKKYYYAMQEFPESIIITVDDDVYYRNDLVEKLLDSYVEYPFAVSAMRAHLITFDSEGEIRPYAEWQRECRRVSIPSFALCATGVGGVLYPPHSLSKEVFNRKTIEECCLYADDLWLKIMELFARTPVVIADSYQAITYLGDSQDTALWRSNDANNRNDIQLAAILEHYCNKFGKVPFMDEMYLSFMYFSDGKKSVDAHDKKLVGTEKQAIIGLKQEIRGIHSSWSYRIGRFITWPYRMVRGFYRCYQEHGWRYSWRRVLVKLHITKY